jgi:probable rRNA maturation factor
MLEVEVLGAGRGAGDAELPSPAQVRRLCILAAGSRGVADGHVAVEFVDEQRIAQLNGEHRNRPEPTDVLSFPIDGAAGALQAGAGAYELGDVIICPARTLDIREAVVHGVLHLLGMDHETDDGEMLTLQRELLAAERR